MPAGRRPQMLLINTPLQRGACRAGATTNRFNGFFKVWETVETVAEVPIASCTPLKRGVNWRPGPLAPTAAFQARLGTWSLAFSGRLSGRGGTKRL